MFATGRNYRPVNFRTKEADISISNSTDAQTAQTSHVQVGGADRWKFFRRPLVPYLSNFIYMKREQARVQTGVDLRAKSRAESPLLRSVYVQTTFR